MVPILDYRTQFDNSDFVVIATPLADTTDTSEHSLVPGIGEAVGVETPFRVSVVLKGDVNVRSFTLYHYREASPAIMANGPFLVSFTPFGESGKPAHSYLMFLKWGVGGRFEPTGG